MNSKKYAAEAIGTFWLTFAGCGSAVIASAFPQVGIGLVGVSLAFGSSVVTMAYAIGHISRCHLNPAVTVGLASGGRFPVGHIAPYIIAQVIGAITAAALLYVVASGAPGFDVSAGFASNGYDLHSPGKYSLLACFRMEVIMTAAFLFIIMGATHSKAPAGLRAAGDWPRVGDALDAYPNQRTNWLPLGVPDITYSDDFVLPAINSRPAKRLPYFKEHPEGGPGSRKGLA